MDEDLRGRVLMLEKQMDALVDRYNSQETMLERHGFDIAFIHAYINEKKAQAASESTVSK